MFFVRSSLKTVMSRRSPRLAALGYYGSEGDAVVSYRDSSLRSPGHGSRHCPICETNNSSGPPAVTRAPASTKSMDVPLEAHERPSDYSAQQEGSRRKGLSELLYASTRTSRDACTAFHVCRDVRTTFKWTPAMKKTTLIILLPLLAFGICCWWWWWWWQPSFSKFPANITESTLPGPLLPDPVSPDFSHWLRDLLSSRAEIDDTMPQQPEIQSMLDSLEKKLLDSLEAERERADMYRKKLETLEAKCGGAATVEDVQRIVQQALSLYQADRIGMADYALESAGGGVIFQHHSPTHQIRAGHFPLFGFPLHYTSEGPQSVIQPEVYPGKCWAFQGSQGFLGISLSYPIYITHVTLEHLPQSLSPSGHINSAPKDFSIYGLATEKEGEERTLLGTFTYDQDREPIQTFELPVPTAMMYSAVELKITSNWGHPEYTCVYRFRVHGRPTKLSDTTSSRTEGTNTTKDTEFHSLL
ncbi:SUN domain-containing protein 2-like isoform X1 [Arapaima gigas]